MPPVEDRFPAPMQAVALDDGRTIELREAYAERALVLVFLRHLGCIFCREIVRSLASHPERNVLFVAMERVEVCAEFRRRMNSPHPIVSDPSRVLYDAFELGRAKFGQVVNPRTILRGLGQMRAGLRTGRPSSDPMALGGVFVVSTKGDVVWSRRSHDVADNPRAEEIFAALDAAEGPRRIGPQVG